MPHLIPQAKRVTRDDVARLAGVSSAVVSYVVNDGPRSVAPETEAKVRHAIKTLGYRPNAAARALALGSSETLAMIIPNSLNPFFASLAREVENASAKRGYTLLLADSQASRQTERRMIKNFAARKVDGIFLWSEFPDPDLSVLEEASIPAVLLNHSTDSVVSEGPAVMIHGGGENQANSVGVAFREGARLAVEHLVSHGHQKIGAIIGSAGYNSTDAREIGWRQGIEQAQLVPGPVIHVPFTREGGFQAGQELLKLEERPSAVFVSSDEQAAGLLCAVQEGGLKLPEDLAVFSFDGSPESEFTWPRLSTVAQPVKLLAQAAVDALLAKPGAGSTSTVLPVELIVRTSCGCSLHP